MGPREPQVITAEAMRGCAVTDGELGYRGITLFPFFDRTGHIETWMMVQPQKERIWFLTEPFRRGVLGGFSYTGRFGEPGPPDAELLDRFAALYHYDPWWLLTVPAFADEDWVPPLKATNVVDWPQCADLSYDRRLDHTAAVLDLIRPEPAETDCGWSVKPPPASWELGTPRGWKAPGTS